jgi:hypothetical protein
VIFIFFVMETHIICHISSCPTMMRLQALLLFVLVLTANAAAQETTAAVIEDSSAQDEVASEQAAPIETASTEGDEMEVGEEVPIDGTDEDSSETVDDAAVDDTLGGSATSDDEALPEPPVQTGPLIDLFGPALLGLEMIDEQHAQLTANYTSDALRGKKVIGVYFSADWCGT